MTLFKLSLRNAKRQASDYLIYFVTIVLAAALLYSFNGLVFSEELQTLASSMSQLPFMIWLASAVVVCVFGWLVSYSIKFMLLRRSRELGNYLLIGLENRQIARLFFLENLAVGGCALVLGILLGSLLYQAFRAIILTLFGLPYHFSFGFSFSAVGLSIIYFALIYLFALRKSRKRIRKMKIYDLIYFDKQNEGVVIQTEKKRQKIFAFSIVLGVVGTLMLITRNLLWGTIGAGCLILFLYGFFLSFASGVPAFFNRKPSRKYRGQNLLIFRTLTAKLATMGVLMATISMIFTATLISEGSGLVFKGLFQGRSMQQTCFDLYIGINDKQQDFNLYLDYINANIPMELSLLYPVYSNKNAQVMEYIDSTIVYYTYGYDKDPLMRYSDYAALREIAGYPAAELKQGQYLIHCISYLEEPLKNYTEPIIVDGKTLTLSSVHTEHFFQNYVAGNGRGYILVVPDDAINECLIHHQAYAAKTIYPVSQEQFAALNAINQSEDRVASFDIVSSKANIEAELASMTTITVFPLYYLALALTMTAATILTIQQLSESQHYRRQFQLLQKLGMDQREMRKALRTQFTIYYTMPAIPPVLIGIPFLLTLAKAPEPGVMVGANSPAAITVMALGIFFLIYAIYILMAYTSLKRNVLPETIE